MGCVAEARAERRAYAHFSAVCRGGRVPSAHACAPPRYKHSGEQQRLLNPPSRPPTMPPGRATCAQERPCAHAHLPHHVAEPRRVLPVAPDRLLQRPPRPLEPRHRPPPPSIQPIRAHPARGLRPILSHLCPPQCKAAVDVRRGEQAPAHAGPAPHLGRKERLRCPGL